MDITNMLVMHWDQFTQLYKDGKTINRNKTDVKCSRFHERRRTSKYQKNVPENLGVKGGEPSKHDPKSNRSIVLLYNVFPEYNQMGGPPPVFVRYS